MKAYLDCSATTPLDPRVLDAMRPFLAGAFGNPSSVHHWGQEARRAVAAARERVATLLGSRDREAVIFTSGGTEADNLAVKGIAGARGDRGRHLVTTAVEHHAILESCASLEPLGFTTTYVPVDADGSLDPEAVREALRPDTILVSVMHANNETGVLHPIGEIGALCRARGIAFHADAVQTVGKIPLDAEALAVDLLSLSAHKFHGPKGVGALYVRPGVRLQPQIHGGGQQRALRPGTENVAGIVGLGAAAALAAEGMGAEAGRIGALRDRLVAGLRAALPAVEVNGQGAPRLPHIANVSFPGTDTEAVLLGLDLEGIAASGGAACSAGSLEPSHVLRAMGLSADRVASAVRFSLGRLTDEVEVEYALAVIPSVVEQVREAAALPLLGRG